MTSLLYWLHVSQLMLILLFSVMRQIESMQNESGVIFATSNTGYTVSRKIGGYKNEASRISLPGP